MVLWMRRIKLTLGEHCFIAGRTGSGKTYLLNAMAMHVSDRFNVIVHDTKGTDIFSKYRIYTRLDELITSKEVNKIGIFVYRPDFEELEMSYYNRFYEWIYYRKNCIVIIDEAMQVCESVSKYPSYLKGILTRGREYNISAWVCTQRPKTLPLFLLSEATKFFVFGLNLLDDRKRIVEITGREEFLRHEACKYCFRYYDIKRNEYYVAKVKTT